MRPSFPFLGAAAALAATALAQQPDQVHLSLSGKAGEMVVEFVSYGQPGENFVWWSTVPFSPTTCRDWSSSSPSSSPSNPLDLPGYVYGAGYLEAGSDLYNAKMTVNDAAAWCSANSTCQGFTFSGNDPLCGGGATCDIYFKDAVAFAEASGWQAYMKPGPPCYNASTSFFEYRNETLGVIGVLHTAVMTGLAPNTSYWYLVGNETGGYSPIYSFTNEPLDRPPVFAIFADFGLSNDESILALYADAESRAFDYVLHAGDWAYDFTTNNGQVGNEFMRDVSGYAAHYPMMPACGNHESHFNFSQYQARFAGVAANAGANSGSGSALYYSFDVPAALTHFVVFSTEAYWASPGIVEAQEAWLRADLAKANANRANIPWIVAFAHKGWAMDTTYCNISGPVPTACTSNGTWFDDALYEAGADFYFVGHLHQYVRWVPNYGTRNLTDLASMNSGFNVATDPKYLQSIITGAPGNPEVQPSSCGAPTPNDNTYPVATCSQNYGYGYLTVHNTTHAHWNWRTTVPIAGSPAPDYSDDFWLIQHNHGPRV